MDISSITSLTPQHIEQAYVNDRDTLLSANDSQQDFGSIFNTALNMVNETNSYQNSAEEAEIKFALGESTSTHELAVAQKKANIALQYTVAVRDKVLEAYKEIMNMTI